MYIQKKGKLCFIVSELTTQQIKVQKHMRYSYHICGDTRHKIIDYPKYNDMQNVVKNKGVTTIEKQVVVNPRLQILEFI
jgi:hypothetical protein